MSDKLAEIKDLTGKYKDQVEFKGYPVFKGADGVFKVPQSLVDQKIKNHPFAWEFPGREAEEEPANVNLTVAQKLDEYKKSSNLEQLQAAFESKYGEKKNDIIDGNPGHKKSYLEPLAKLVADEDKVAIEIVEELYSSLN